MHTTESYLKERLFPVKLKEETRNVRKIEAGVPQGSVLGPLLCVINTSNLPTSVNTTTATYTDDTVI
jgi:retron-type reverse transcriptase